MKFNFIIKTNNMSDGSPSLFDRVLDTTPDSNEDRLVFPWHRGKKPHITKDFNDDFSNGRISQKHIDDLVDDLKNSEYWDPELTFGTRMVYIGVALGVFALFMIPAWILLASSSTKLGIIYLGNILIVLGILAPAITILFYSKAQKKRYEAREVDFKERLIPHNRKNFIPHDLPIKMSLFGAYFTIEKPDANLEPAYGPLVTSGRKKLTKEEQKFELAYLDVDEEVENIEQNVPQRQQSSVRPSARNIERAPLA
jgi:hypothetical protein